ncbi:transcriptional regulator GlxA family with amidase domain [Bradyrhizobium sp. USDA 4354]
MADAKIKTGSASGKLPCRKLAVGFVLLPSFTLIAFSSIIDLLRLAADEGDRSRPERCSWSILAPDLKPISASCGLHVAPWETFDRPERFDYIVVVGGLLDRGLIYHSKTLQFLRQAAARGVSIAGVCTGSFALAEAQLLRGRKCCVSWYHFPDFVERYADITPVGDQLFIQDGKFITCAGGLAALDLAAWMVERHLGPGRAQKSLHIMITDKARLAAHAQPQPPSMATVDDTRVRRAMLVIEQNLSTPPKTREIATKVGLSKRQLERLFRNATGRSIQGFSRDLRIFYGLWLLAESDKSITSIATESGFSDISHFNRIFRGAFGCAPSIARRNGIASMKALIHGWQDKQAGSPAARFGSIGLSASDWRLIQQPLITSSDGNNGGEMIREIKSDPGGFLQRERRPYF